MGLPKIFKLIISILICEGAGVIGSFFTAPAITTWYQTLNKPFFTPPSSIFAPVWIILYFLMGVSLYLVWEKGLNTRKVKHALLFFGLQLILNVSWSALFFGLHSPLDGLIAIIVLWCLILLTVIYFLKVSKTAGYLLYPYLVWVTFAAFLNLSIYLLNR